MLGLFALARTDKRLAATLAAAVALCGVLYRFCVAYPWLWPTRAVVLLDVVLLILFSCAVAYAAERARNANRKWLRWRPSLIGVVLVVLAIVCARQVGMVPLRFMARHVDQPFRTTPTSAQREVIDFLDQQTSDDHRILIEAIFLAPSFGYRYATLARIKTGRQFVGGPAEDNQIVANKITFSEGYLAGKPIGDYGPGELARFVATYNVGWAFARMKQSIAAFDRLPGLFENVGTAGVYRVYRVRNPGGYFQKGTGTVQRADVDRIVLSSLVPDEGQIVLRYHFAEGMQTEPAVRIDGNPVDGDPQAFIRLWNPPPDVVITFPR